MRPLVFVGVFLLLVFTQTRGSSVWVDSVNGSDSASGTKEAPFLSVAHALSSVTTSDAYTGQPSTINLVSANYTLSTSESIGTNGLQITITSTVKSVLITGVFGVSVYGNGSITFNNISIFPSDGYSSEAVLSVDQTSATFTDCYFANFNVAIRSVFLFYSTSTFGSPTLTITNCVFEGIAPGIQEGAVISLEGTQNSTYYAVIQDTTFQRINNTGFIFYLYNASLTIKDSSITDNQNTGQLLDCEYSSIQSQGTQITTNTSPILECYYCTVHTDTSYGVAASGCAIYMDSTTGVSSSGSNSGINSGTNSGSSTTASSDSVTVYPVLYLIALLFAVLQ